MIDNNEVSSLSVPTGPSACARAATTKEATFRIDYPLAAARNTRVVALDDDAAIIVREAAQLEWGEARFYTVSDPGLTLDEVGSESTPLTAVLEGSNTVIAVSVTGEGSEAAATIGTACRARGVMMAGLVVTPGVLNSDALHHLRPYARILLVPADPQDLVELLTATRA